MKLSETLHIFAAIIVLFAIIAFPFAIKREVMSIATSFIFAAAIIFTAVFSKKLMAEFLDADVEHRVWGFSRWGFRPHQKLGFEIPGGIIFPLFFSFFSLGFTKFMSILTYETSALKTRAAKRHGFYSFTEMTDWHNALIGAAGIVSVLLLALVIYLLPFREVDYLAKMASYYAFCNMIPLLKFDGSQIFFGSRVLWTALAVLTTIFFAVSLLII